MLKKLGVFFSVFVFMISLAGCATGRKQKDLEMQGLKNQVSVLEAQVQSKDEEKNSLRDQLNKATVEQQKIEPAKKESKKRIIGEAKRHPKAKQIQTALENAGYNPGPIDGHMGKQTKEAIKAFQKANNLKETGKVDKETWNLLKESLNKKVK
jgi:peptidoglycan hydrolase-like protein with peptidoglycan-binding domain